MASDDEGWTPERERENDPDNLQREMLEFGKKALENLKRQQAHPAASAVAIGAGQFQGEVTIRAIENGFILAWDRWTRAHGYFVADGPRREVYVKDADDALPHLREAMASLRKAVDIPPPM